MTTITTPAFGTYQLTPLERMIVAATRSLPAGWLFLRLSFVLRKFVLRRLHHPVDIRVWDQNMRLHPHDNLCEKRVLFTPQLFDTVERALLAERLHDHFTFLDIGANVGVYSLFVAGRAGPGAKIVAVEPDPVIFQRLKFNLASNTVRSVLAVAVAVTAQPGRAPFYIDRKNRGSSSLVGNQGESAEVPCTTLLQLLDDHEIWRPDAIKMDIEGIEHQVLITFFAHAPPERYPKLLILENYRKEPLNAAARLTVARGYQVHCRTRMNVVLELQS